MRAMHRCVTVCYQQIENGNIANQIHGFKIDYGKFILIRVIMYPCGLSIVGVKLKLCKDRTRFSARVQV